MKNLHQIQLLQQRIVLTGDTDAFRQLYFLLAVPLKHFAFTIIHSHEQAEEIVEDVFIKFWEGRKSMGAIINLRVYLYVAARNTAINYSKKLSGRQDCDFIDFGDVEIATADPDPEQIFISSEMRRRIDEVIQKLPPKCKLIFKLAKEDRLKYREIADILKISIKTIDNQLAIALKKISEAIQFNPSPIQGARKA